MRSRRKQRGRGPDVLVASEIGVRFGGVRALDAVSISVAGAAITGIVGPNGAGKSTLFDVLAGAIAPERGAVFLDGRDVTSLPPHRRARLGIRRTFQQLETFPHLTVAENLLVALEAREPSSLRLVADALAMRRAARRERAAREQVQEILELAGLGQVADRVAGTLPLGVARLVELARALCPRPRALLLDEPSGGLDPAETQRLAALIARLRDELRIAVLLVEHDIQLVSSLCDDVFVLDFGRVIAHGPPERALADPRVRAAYLGAEAL